MRRFAVLGCAIALAVGPSGCSTADSTAEAAVETSGGCENVFGGEVCSWSKAVDGRTVEVGMTVPLATIENAPESEMPAWPPHALAVLDVPEAARAGSGFDHITLYWEAMGHPPGAYLTPHFDFHFYRITTAERAAIDCSDLTKPSTLPAAFGLPDVPLPPEMAAMTGVPTLVGLCVPEMGMHAALQTELESTAPFRGTMIVGYYAGTPIFEEPMISRAMLLERQSFDLPIPEVPGLSGPHPTTFHAEYDAASDAYRFVLSGFSAG